MAELSLVDLAEAGELAELRRRLDAGADVNAPDPDGRVALHAAFAESYLEIVELLLERGADARLADGRGCGVLHWAASANDRAILELARDVSNAAIDVVDGEGRTALSWAAAFGDSIAIAWLLENGADPNHVDADGWGALHHAAAVGNVDSIQQLLRAGARPLLRLPPNEGEDYGHAPSDLARHFAPDQPEALAALEFAEDPTN